MDILVGGRTTNRRNYQA